MAVVHTLGSARRSTIAFLFCPAVDQRMEGGSDALVAFANLQMHCMRHWRSELVVQQ